MHYTKEDLKGCPVHRGKGVVRTGDTKTRAKRGAQIIHDGKTKHLVFKDGKYTDSVGNTYEL